MSAEPTCTCPPESPRTAGHVPACPRHPARLRAAQEAHLGRSLLAAARERTGGEGSTFLDSQTARHRRECHHRAAAPGMPTCPECGAVPPPAGWPSIDRHPDGPTPDYPQDHPRDSIMDGIDRHLADLEQEVIKDPRVADEVASARDTAGRTAEALVANLDPSTARELLVSFLGPEEFSVREAVATYLCRSAKAEVYREALARLNDDQSPSSTNRDDQ